MDIKVPIIRLLKKSNVPNTADKYYIGLRTTQN